MKKLWSFLCGLLDSCKVDALPIASVLQTARSMKKTRADVSRVVEVLVGLGSLGPSAWSWTADGQNRCRNH